MSRSLLTRLVVVIAALAIRAVFEAAYADTVAVEFAYAGFGYFPSTGYVLVTYAVTFAYAWLVPLETTPAKTAVLLLFLLFFVPLGVIASVNDKSLWYYFLCCVFMAILMMVVRIKVRPLLHDDFPYGTEIFTLAAITCVSLTILIFILEGGLSYVNFDFTEIYDVRGEINDILTGPVGYISDWSKNVFLPGLLAFNLWKRNWLMVGVALFLFFIFFGVTSAKAVIAYPVLVGMLYLGVRSGRLPVVISGTVFAGVALPWLMFKSIGDNFLSSTLLSRLYSVPPFDTYRYYEYFVNSDKMYMRNTLLGAPFRTFETDQIALIIGQNAWGYGTETYTNVGIFGTAYMHFGALGMVLFPVLVGLALLALDKLALNRIPMDIAVPLTMVVAMQFHSSDLTTTMLSHGLLMMYACLLLVGQRSELKPGVQPSMPLPAGAPPV